SYCQLTKRNRLGIIINPGGDKHANYCASRVFIPFIYNCSVFEHNRNLRDRVPTC
ncbi:MAG: hypothetical protein HeimAB125_07990, partial [Candidatus Heimdallarchaeota archaeon AB_125]